MPLIAQDYSLKGALDLISGKLPGETALDALVDALHVGDPQATIICDKSGNAFNIPSSAWKSSDGRFTFSADSGQGSIEKRLVRRPAPYSSRFTGKWDRDGKFSPNHITGEIRINRQQLDALLDGISLSVHGGGGGNAF